jgi:hypothetical protein
LPISLHSSAVLFFTIHENVAKSRGDKIPDADLLAQFFEKRGPSGGLENNRTAHMNYAYAVLQRWSRSGL